MNSGAESDEAEFSDSEDSDASSWCSDEAEVLIHKRWRRDAQTKSSGTSTRDWVMNMDGKYDTRHDLSQEGRRLNIRAQIQGIFRWSIVFAELRPFGRIKKIHPF